MNLFFGVEYCAQNDGSCLSLNGSCQGGFKPMSSWCMCVSGQRRLRSFWFEFTKMRRKSISPVPLFSI